MPLSPRTRDAKLRALVAAEGYETLDDLLEAVITDSVCPAICVTDGCSYTHGMEPDQDRGWCEACGANTVRSALILAGVI
jgi:hypothetical protein